MAHTKNESNPSENMVYQNIRTVLVTARQKVCSAINSAMVEAYWEIGRQIEQAVGDRAEYGKGLLKFLSIQLTGEFGKGFDESSLRRMRQFSQVFPIRNALRLELSWTHYRLLMRLDNEPRREFYLKDLYIREFLDLSENKKYHESELEQSLINNLQKFLLELGKSFSLVARQKRITIE